MHQRFGTKVGNHFDLEVADRGFADRLVELGATIPANVRGGVR